MFKVSISDGISSDTTTINVTVHPQPTPGVTVAGSILTTTSYSTYQWTTTTGSIPGATTASYTAATTGTYYVTVTDANGCTGTSTGQTVAGLGVNDYSTGEVSYFPNPVINGRLNLYIPSLSVQKAQICICNLLGSTVKEFTVDNNKLQTFLIDDLSPGIYYLRVVAGDLNSTSKITVQ